jgi:glucose-1-phosphate thymidylyltransferase
MTDETRSVGVVPAAGYASRLQPLAGSKEMIEVHGRPVVEFLLDCLRMGDCDEIRVVTRPEKHDLAVHAAAQGVTVVLARPASVSESLLAGITGLSDDDVVLAGFPDTLWLPLDGFKRLRARLTGRTEIVLGLFRVNRLADCDRVQIDESGEVLSIRVKPNQAYTDLTWGCFAARAGALRGLDVPEPGEYFDSLCAGDRLAGLVLSDRYLDIGTREGLRRVTSWPAVGQR